MRSRTIRSLTAHGAFIALATAGCGGAESTRPSPVVVPGPAFTGRVLVAGGAACPAGAWVFAGPAGRQDSVAVRADCSFALPSDYVLGDTARIVVSASPATKGFLGRVPKRYYSAMNIVAIPTAWTIAGGAFDGRRVPIDLEAAYALPGGRTSDASFYLRVGNPWRYVVGSYANLPVPTAFCRNSSNRAISAADSAAFWVIMAAFDVSMGRKWYAPASEGAVCGASKVGFELVRDSTGGGIPVGGITTPFRRDYQKGVMNGDWKQESRKCFIDVFCVQHEMTHGLGFGHTCSWPSLMESCGVRANQTDIPSVTDVAYEQLMFAVAETERTLRTRLGLPQAHQFERVSKGLPEEAVDVFEPEP